MAEHPAGWYRDPRGEAEQRYWDGSAWTDQTRPPVPPTASPPPSAASANIGFPSPPPPGAGAVPPPPPTGGYAQPVGAWPTKSQAGVALALSIVSIFICGPLSIAGIVMGRNEVQAIDRGEADPSKRGMAQAAFVVGIVAAVLWVVGIILLSAA